MSCSAAASLIVRTAGASASSGSVIGGGIGCRVFIWVPTSGLSCGLCFMNTFNKFCICVLDWALARWLSADSSHVASGVVWAASMNSLLSFLMLE